MTHTENDWHPFLEDKMTTKQLKDQICLHEFSKPAEFETHTYYEYEINGGNLPWQYLVKAWVFTQTGETDWEVWDWNDDHCVVDTRTSPGTEVCKIEVHDAINQSIKLDGDYLSEPWYDPSHIDPRA
tara:strand:+ start:1337 stop:1717 length:381 start_codon:yes stop_codon:yes gene_type:complete